MKLEEKGNVTPPPVLSRYLEIVSQEIQHWQGIISATHWEIYNNNKANGADFYFGEQELGHIHLDGSIHLPSTKEYSQTLIKSGLAQKFPYGQNWVQFQISDQKSADHAIWIFKLHYDHLSGADSSTIMNTIAEYKELA